MQQLVIRMKAWHSTKTSIYVSFSFIQLMLISKNKTTNAVIIMSFPSFNDFLLLIL